MGNAKNTLNEYNEIKGELVSETSKLAQQKKEVFGLSKDQKQVFVDMLKGGVEKDEVNNIYKQTYGDKLQNRKEFTQKFKEENKALIEKYKGLGLKKKLDEETFQRGLKEFRVGNTDIDEKVLRELFFGTSEQKENYNEEIYQERASHKHDEITTEDFESLKPLTARYSYTMQGDVKIHKVDEASFYIANYDKVGLIYSDMDLQKGSTEKKPKEGERKFENIENSYKMQKFAKENGLDILSINFKESLNTFLSIGQAVADAYSMGITFDVDFLDKSDNKQINRILYGIYTIIGEKIYMPYKIDENGFVSSCGVRSGGAWTDRNNWGVLNSLSSLLNYRS